MSRDLLTELELRTLSDRYARAVDRGDGVSLAELFERSAVFRYFAPDGTVTERTGDDIQTIPARVAHYAATYHHVGTATYEVDGDSATGEVSCLAHHLAADRLSNEIAYVRYLDRYRRGPGGTWRIAERKVLVDWTEIRPTGGPVTRQEKEQL